MNKHNIFEDDSQTTDKQFHQMLSIIDYLLEEGNNSTTNTIVNLDQLRQLKQELMQKQGEDLNPAQLNTTILMLLDYVIKTIALI